MFIILDISGSLTCGYISFKYCQSASSLQNLDTSYFSFCLYLLQLNRPWVYTEVSDSPAPSPLLADDSLVNVFLDKTDLVDDDPVPLEVEKFFNNNVGDESDESDNERDKFLPVYKTINILHLK